MAVCGILDPKLFVKDVVVGGLCRAERIIRNQEARKLSTPSRERLIRDGIAYSVKINRPIVRTGGESQKKVTAIGLIVLEVSCTTTI